MKSFTHACAAVAVMIWFAPASHQADAAEVAPVPEDLMPKHLALEAVPRGLSGQRSIPAGNELTAERARLGRRLFFDPVLSSDRSVACVSCHDPSHGFADHRPISPGVGNLLGTRNSPSLLNRAFGRSFFWDGRSSSLEDQALQPIENPLEMATSVSEVLRRLQNDADYREQFGRAYEEGVTAENLARALASFQRVLLSGDSLVDRFITGSHSGLTPKQKQGLWLFESRGGCWRCHSGPNYTDESFHNTGVSWGKRPLDLGRFDVTQQEEDRGRFKTPSLRDVASTAPYMHDGSIDSLIQVVEFYNQGGGANEHLDAHVKPLELSKPEMESLVDFLQALTGSTDWTAQRVATPGEQPLRDEEPARP